MDKMNTEDLINGHPIVFTFSGKAGSGKDTCGEIVKQIYKNSGKKVLHVNFADFLKTICIKNFGYDESNKEEGRHILQEFGTDIARANSPTIWVDTVYHLFDTLRFEYDAFIICDARFDNELQPFPYKFTYPIVNIFVKRNSEGKIGNDEKQHSSEAMAADPDLSKFHYIVDNNGTLENTAEQILNIIQDVEEKREKMLMEQRGFDEKTLDEMINILEAEEAGDI